MKKWLKQYWWIVAFPIGMFIILFFGMWLFMDWVREKMKNV